MANIKQQIKRSGTDVKKRAQNRMFKSQMRTAIKKATIAIQEQQDQAKILVNYANKLLDKAVSKKIKSKNFVNRKKSQLAKQLHNM